MHGFGFLGEVLGTGKGRQCRDAAPTFGQQPGQSQGQRRFAGPVGSGDTQRLTGVDPQVQTRHDGGTGGCSGYGQPSGAQQAGGRFFCRGQCGQYGRVAGDPDPGVDEPFTEGAGSEQPGRCALVGHTTAGLQHDHPIHGICPGGEPVLNDDHRCSAGAECLEHCVPHFQHPVGVEICCRLIQQDESGAHGQDPGQGQALLLPSRQGRGGVVQWQVKSHRLQGFADAGPDQLRVHREVLRAKGDVVPHPGLDDLGFGVLLHQTGPAAGCRSR